MGLSQTQSSTKPDIPPPVLHTFSAERSEVLGVPPGQPFFEETTFWNPSWTTAQGAVQTTNICDWTTSMEAIGAGKLLSPESHRVMVQPSVGFGHRQEGCPACAEQTPVRGYGIGVEVRGAWTSQIRNFAGAVATTG